MHFSHLIFCVVALLSSILCVWAVHITFSMFGNVVYFVCGILFCFLLFLCHCCLIFCIRASVVPTPVMALLVIAVFVVKSCVWD